MNSKPTLILPETYEALVRELGDDLIRMTKFVVPVEEAEKELTVIAQSMRHTGKVVFLLGAPGIGKSTFIQSLTWSSPLAIPKIEEIDTDKLGPSSAKLQGLYDEIYRLVEERQKDKPALFTVVINYLEDFSGQADEDVKAFFRDLNGLLRRNPVLIIWPVTQENEVEKMLSLASAVSGTVFADKPILEFGGPPFSLFPKIAKNTIAALNPSLSLEDFQFTDDDFEDLLFKLSQQGSSKCLIRNYLTMIYKEWRERSGQIDKLLSRIPTTTEVWFAIQRQKVL